MKKGLLIGGLIIAGAGIGALAHKVISKPKEEKVEVIKEKKVNNDDWFVKTFGMLMGMVVITTLIEYVSAYLLFKTQQDADVWEAIQNNRNFNEMNFVMTVCHMCDTDTTTSVTDKIKELKRLIDSGKLGETAVGLLKEQINELAEVK
jgi:hypothetical protein